MNHRFHSMMTTVICTLLIVGTCSGVWQIEHSSVNDNANETTALSLSASPQLLQQLDTDISLRLHSLFPGQNRTNPSTASASAQQIMLYPGGQPIGILLRTDGILVVGYSPVQTEQAQVHPAESAGIQAGDVITCVNGTAVTHDDQLAAMINQLGTQGEQITLQLQRQNKELSRTITPVYCEQTHSYRIGLFIRDNAGGVGTLTFVDPQTMQYGALGHMIANSETQRKLSILNGKLVAADIQGIKKGISGSPGEKIGRFVSNDALGTIDKNTASGIFGTLSDRKFLLETIVKEPMPIGDPTQIEIGPATIYTALEGHTVMSYTIEIEKLMPSGRDGKNMVIRVTDPELLTQTGGIVQGMSGSPIIQNGHIIGAVTHVFVNDPTRGYGIFIENMLEEAA